MKSVLFSLSALICLVAASAGASEAIQSIEPSTWEDAQYNVAQVVNVQTIQTKEISATLTTVYRGSVSAPFGVYLNVWDPLALDGSDFGVSKSFDLGTYSTIPRLVSKKQSTLGADELKFEVIFGASILNSDATGSERFKHVASVKIKGGEVQSPLYLKRIK